VYLWGKVCAVEKEEAFVGLNGFLSFSSYGAEEVAEGDILKETGKY
jgi:hypothetical protein